MTIKSVLTLALVFCLTGCSTTVQRPEPITLAEALKEVIEALNEISDIPVKSKHGLVPAEVTVTFEITAGRKEGKSASVDIVPTGIIEEIGGISSKWTSEVTESRGNTIVIKFRSILFASEKELIAQKTPEEIDALYQKLKNQGWTIKGLGGPRM